MFNAKEIVEESMKRAGEPLDEKLKSLMTLIVDASLRSGYNQAVKDHENGISLVKKDMTIFRGEGK